MRELEPRGFVSAETRRLYLSLWHLLIARGLVVAHQHVHGNEEEDGTKRIRPHLPMPILLYLPMECIRFRVPPRRETIELYRLGARLMRARWLKETFGIGPASAQPRQAS
jgi:hypothetical protein